MEITPRQNNFCTTQKVLSAEYRWCRCRADARWQGSCRLSTPHTDDQVKRPIPNVSFECNNFTSWFHPCLLWLFPCLLFYYVFTPSFFFSLLNAILAVEIMLLLKLYFSNKTNQSLSFIWKHLRWDFVGMSSIVWYPWCHKMTKKTWTRPVGKNSWLVKELFMK